MKVFDAVAGVVGEAEPEVIVHQLTALSGPMRARDARHPERCFAVTMTNRLRTEATDHLLAAGRVVGARRFVAQSFAAFRFSRTGGPVQTEADPLDPDLPAALRAGLAGILHLEQAVTTMEWGEGLVLRYGGFYGPGTGISLAPDAVMAAPIRKRRFPLVGDGGGVWSFVHIEDAAAATAAAVDHGQPGVYNVVDDDPAPVREWLQLARRFLAAVSNGDLQALEDLLAHDVVLHGDGGGRVRTITRPVHGRAKVARLLLSGMRAAELSGGWSLRQVQVNGQPGAMASDAAGKLTAVVVLDIADGHIQACARSSTRTSCATSIRRRQARQPAASGHPVRAVVVVERVHGVDGPGHRRRRRAGSAAGPRRRRKPA